MTARSPDAAPRVVDMLVITVVWGDWHLDALLDVNLPTLLTPRNLPVLLAEHRASWQIHTRARDVARIRSAPTFQALEKLVPVTFHIIADEGRLRDPIGTHVAIWKSAIDEAAATGRFAFLMPPDVLWSDGSFAHVSALLRAGKRAIYLAFIRVASESFLPDFHRRFGARPLEVAISGNGLVELCIEHLHPLMAAHAREARYAPSHTEMMIWPVPGEGLALRVFARELFVFDATIPMTATQLIDGVLPPEELHMVSDSDELFAVSLAPLGKDAAWHTVTWRVTTLDVAQWWLVYDAPTNDFVASAAVRWHYTPVTERAWRAREIATALFTRRAALEREAARLLNAVSSDRAARGTSVAQLLALALLSGRLTRALRGLGRQPPAVVVFVPQNRALHELRYATWLLDLARQPDGRLEHTVREHVALTPELPRDGVPAAGASLALRTLNGRSVRLQRGPGGLTVDGVAVAAVERLSATVALCYIDGILGADAAAAGE